MPAVDQELEKNQRPHSAGDAGQSPSVSDGGIHVYAHQRSERTIRATRSGSEEVGEVLRSGSSPKVALGRLWLMFVNPAEAAEGTRAPGWSFS